MCLNLQKNNYLKNKYKTKKIQKKENLLNSLFEVEYFLCCFQDSCLIVNLLKYFS